MDASTPSLAAFFTGESGERHIIQILKTSPVICGDEQLAKRLAKLGAICEFAKGDNIIREADDEDDIHFLLRGEAAIHVDGIEVNRRNSTRADHVGEMSLIDPSACRSATVVALKPTVTLKVSEPDFTEVAKDHPELWRELAVELARRNRQRNEHTKSTRHGPTVSPDAPHWKQVVKLLERVPAGLHRWTWEPPYQGNRVSRQWQIDNEYHVQNLLYLMLAPVFPDIQDENYSESVGHKRPRFDIFIPSLNLVIEVKFIRPHVSFTNIEGELAEDATFYRSCEGGNDRKIIAFIWDDSARVNKHDLMKQGVRRMDGIDDIVIVSRPSQFVDAAVASPPNQNVQP